MRTYKKRWRIPLLVLLLAAALTACQAADDAEEEEEEAETTLIYAVLSKDGVDERAINQFNVRHRNAGVRIEVRYYLDEDGWDGKSRLLTEMASGRVPDIIDMGGSSGLPYRQLVRRGYLEDLWPYINSDPYLNDGKLWDAPLKAAEVDGGLYIAFTEVCIHTVIGRESVVGTGFSWTVEDLMNAFAAMPDESSVLEYYLTKSDMFYYLFRMNLDGFVDWKTGENHFDSETFRAALEFINSFPDSFPSLEFEGGWEKAQEEVGDMVRHGQQMLSVQDIKSILDIQALDKVFARKEQVSLIGYPMEDGSAGSVFTIQGRTLAMSSTCQDKEAAWDFLRMAFTKKTGIKTALNSYTFPVNRANFDNLVEVALRPPRYADGRGYRFFNGMVVVGVKRVKADVVNRFLDLCEHIDKVDLYDTSLYDIVWDACGLYFSGDKTLDETIEVIDNRVSLYVNEQI